jgi:dUTP pyrophosphatase
MSEIIIDGVKHVLIESDLQHPCEDKCSLYKSGDCWAADCRNGYFTKKGSVKEDIQVEVVEGGKAPMKGSEDAACYDVYAREVRQVDDFYYKVKLGIKTAIPKGFHAKLVDRSGVTDTGWGLCNSLGVIDADFRGEWQARFRPYVGGWFNGWNDNVTLEIMKFPYEVGDRVAQFMIEKNCELELNLVDSVDADTERGAGGFNSTGRK